MAAPASCIQLRGSELCPGFVDQYINPATLRSAWPFFNQVTDVASFDRSFESYLTDAEGFRRTKFGVELGCAGYATPYTLQWTQTFLCGEFTQIAYSDACYPDAAIRRMTCQKTCFEWGGAEVDLIGNSTVCPGNTLGSSAARQAQMTNDLVQCTTWSTLASNDTQTCVLGEQNEPNCGFGATTTSQVCDYCNPARVSGGALLPPCCIGARTDLTACNFASAIVATQASSLPPSTTLTFVPSSSIAASVSSLLAAFSSQLSSEIAAASDAAANAAAASYAARGGLSAGAKAGIAIGSIIGGLLLIALLAALFLCCRQRQKNKDRDSESRSTSAAGIFRSRSREHSMSIADTERSYMTEKKGGIRNFLVGVPGIGNKVSTDGHDDDGNGNGTGAGNTPATGGASPGVGQQSFGNGAQGGSGGNRGLGIGGAALGAGAAAGAAAAGSSEKSRPISGATMDSGVSADDGRNLVDSHTDQYTNTVITPGSDVLAIYAYNPTLPDELKLDPDMIVTIRKIFDDGWAVGAITRNPDGSKPNNGFASPKEGAFPLICTCNASAEALMTDGATSTRSSSGPASVGRRGTSSRNQRSLLDPSERTESFNSAVSRLDDGTSTEGHGAGGNNTSAGSGGHGANYGEDGDREETMREGAGESQGWFSGILGTGGNSSAQR